MDESIRRALAGSLGNPTRDFKEEPLTDQEIQAVIYTYSWEATRKDLDPALREIYLKCIEILKNYLVFH